MQLEKPFRLKGESMNGFFYGNTIAGQFYCSVFLICRILEG